jgi:hypothetical protein
MKNTATAEKKQAPKRKRAPVFYPKTFGQSLNQAKKLMPLIESGTLTERQIKLRVSKFMINSDTVRGFCIVLLTGDYKVSDNQPAAMVDAMRSGSAAVFEVMAKNLVMAPTMAVTHRRNNDAFNLAGSDRSTARTIKLIHLIASEKMIKQLNEMQSSFRGEEAAYTAFVKEWQYLEDPEQVAAAHKALDAALKKNAS